ncbi:MAG: hypothetical protein NTV63_05835 [Candidatus Woesearchaeota archaeon]|nr:hypothetical protein [Candidatus Woesearchaeota archaeon]
MKQQRKQPGNEELFVPLRYPDELRLRILALSKGTVALLQMHDGILRLREQKEESMVELKKTFDELSTLMDSLRKAVIRSKSVGEKQIVSMVASKQHFAAEKPAAEKQVSEAKNEKGAILDNLEKELSEIEKKLGKI